MSDQPSQKTLSGKLVLHTNWCHRLTPSPDSIKFNLNIQVPPHIRAFNFLSKPPSLPMVLAHLAGRTNAEPPAPCPNEPPSIRRVVSERGLQFQPHPLAPPGTKVLIFEVPKKYCTFAQHDV